MGRQYTHQNKKMKKKKQQQNHRQIYTNNLISMFFSFLFFIFRFYIHFNQFRMLTFCYLAAFNWWLVLCPSTLSHDWQMGSIPLLTSISDPRNLLTLWAFASTVLMLHKGILDFEVIDNI